MESVEAILWRVCQAADLQALRDTQGFGHEVIAWRRPTLWPTLLNINIKPEAKGGTVVPLEPEPGSVQGVAREMHLYAAAYRGGEIRLKVPPLIEGDYLLIRHFKLVADRITDTDPFLALVVKTRDGGIHLRGALLSELPAKVQALTGNGRTATGGQQLSPGVALDQVEQDVWETLVRHKNVLLYGPAGTGKTRLMLRIKDAFENGVMEIAFDPAALDHPLIARHELAALPSHRHTRFTTFHQSLTYENFVVGLRPRTSPSGITFEPEDGMFLMLAASALQTDSCALLLVDEFNRGNVADILGELITLIEPDKRLDSAGNPTASTVTATLPLTPAAPELRREFSMPFHLYILAAMNSLDRSVAPLDTALRRRFRMVLMRPDEVVATSLLLQGRPITMTLNDAAAPSRDEAASIALRVWSRINQHIETYWGPEFLLGQSFILGVADAASLIDTYNQLLLPQLIELYRDQPQAFQDLMTTGDDAEEPLVTFAAEPLPDLLIAGGTPMPRADPLDTADVTRSVRRLYRFGFGRNPPVGSGTAGNTAPTEAGPSAAGE